MTTVPPDQKFEWLGIQCAVENKDVSWNSAFSR